MCEIVEVLRGALQLPARVRAGGVTITRSLRAGNINYKSVPQLKGVDLERYRGKASEVVTVRIEKKESA